jgi:Cu(I)/Ag(I) efflux system protein CusF
MMKIRILVAVGALTLAALGSSDAIAQTDELIAGQVTKVDESAGKITIKHGPLKKFDMEDGMTMVFRAGDPAMLKAVKAGDKVRFVPDRVNGQFTVTKIEKTK